MRRIAVIGSGISGLAAAYTLADPGHPRRARVTLFEAGRHFGGHTHTVDVTLPDRHGRTVTHGVDTGFLVFNHRTYPRLRALFETLGVGTVASDMSFSVQADGLEWSGHDLNTVFAQRSNLLKPRFWRMLADILRFNRLCSAIGERGDDRRMGQQPIGDFLAEHGFSSAFRDGYFLPMIGCIWSCPTAQMLHFPVGTMVRFCHNHGLIRLANRPQWYTVRGGARQYVEEMLKRLGDARLATPVRQVTRIPGGVLVATDAGTAHFDTVVFACHSDQALALLADPSPAETSVLGAIRYHANRAVLHTDASLLPGRRLAWAAWNYQRAELPGREQAGICLHYLMNRLQPLPFAQPLLVSLNPARAPAAACVLDDYAYAHPVFDLAAIAAQRRLPEIQGRQRTWYCGAWTGDGFHEDGLKSGLAAAAALLSERTASELPEPA